MEAQRCVKLTGTNEPCGLTIFLFFHVGREELPFAGYSVVTRSLNDSNGPNETNDPNESIGLFGTTRKAMRCG